MKTNYDIIIIGAGAVGCAIARELSRYDLSVVVLEKECDVAGGTSGRNSAVVHAGFNNRPGSRMAEFCVRGNEGFAQVCKALDVPYRKTGKLIVALTEDDLPSLQRIYEQGLANGCRDLALIGPSEMEKLVPGVPGIRAMYSPHTAITDPFLYTVALAENAHENGVEFRFNTEVTGIRRGVGPSRFGVQTADGILWCSMLVNSAGLGAAAVSSMLGIAVPAVYPCRGEYYILDKASSASLPMPVYPAPAAGIGGLGVHLTPTVHGNVIIGPSAEYIGETDDYSCTRPVMDQLLTEARELMPSVDVGKVIGNFSGIRPKLAGPSEGGYHDFLIEEPKPGFIHLLGIESPGLTASVPIGEEVCRMVIADLTRLPGKGRVPGKKTDFCGTRRGIIRFREQSPEVQARLIESDPEYGEIFCRCQRISKREIRQAIENPLGARSISAIKYRAWPTTGRCNGGYCLPKIVDLLIREYGMKPEEITYRSAGSEMFTGSVKE